MSDSLALNPVAAMYCRRVVIEPLYEDQLPLSDVVAESDRSVWFLRRRSGSADVIAWTHDGSTEVFREGLPVLQMKGPFLSGVVLNLGHELLAVDRAGARIVIETKDPIVWFDVTPSGAVLCISKGELGDETRLHVGSATMPLACVAVGLITGAVWASDERAVFQQQSGSLRGGRAEIVAREANGQQLTWATTKLLLSPEMGGSPRGRVFVAGGVMGSPVHGGWILGSDDPLRIASIVDLPLYGRPCFVDERSVVFPTYSNGAHSLVEAGEVTVGIHQLSERPGRSIALLPGTRRVVWAQPTKSGGRLAVCDLRPNQP